MLQFRTRKYAPDQQFRTQNQNLPQPRSRTFHQHLGPRGEGTLVGRLHITTVVDDTKNADNVAMFIDTVKDIKILYAHEANTI